MVVKAKTKKMLLMTLVIVMVAILISGIGIGIYFFVKDKSGEKGLSREQVAFGNAVKNYNNLPSITKKNFGSSLDGFSLQNILAYSDEYVAISEDGSTSFINLTNKQSKNLSFAFDQVISIYGKLVHVKKSNVNYLINIDTDKVFVTFTDAELSYSNDYLFIKTFKSEFQFVKSENILNVFALVINTKTGDDCLVVKSGDDIIDVNFGTNFVVVYEKTKTTVYCLSDFSVVLSLQNSGDLDESKYNIQSILNKSYFMTIFHKVSELSNSMLLIEKTELSDSLDYDISKSLSNSENAFYKLSYNFYDTNTKIFSVIDSNGCVVSKANVEFSNAYVGILKSKILSKKTISDETVAYYYYVSSNENLGKDNKLSLKEVLSYDYNKYGTVVGYEKGKLLTAGGTASNVIDFNGNKQNVVLENAGEKSVNSSWNSGAVIFSSVNGLYGLRNSDGEILFNATFEKISPINLGNMIAKKNGKYYILNVNKQIETVQNFANEFEEYVFAGVGFYFTKNIDGTYNVFTFDKNVYKQNVAVKFVGKASNSVNIIFGEEMINVRPTKNLEINIYREVERSIISSRAFAFNANVRNAINGGEELKPESISVDNITGAGFAMFKGNLNLSDINEKLVSYSAMTAEQKALIPAFDDASKLSYNVTTEGVTTSYILNGSVFYANDYIALAIMSLTEEGTQNTYFIVNLALKNVYLKSANFLSFLNETSSNMICFNEGSKLSNGIAFEKQTVAGSLLSGDFGLYNEESSKSSRTINYALAGYDGGLVFASNSATSVSFEVTISNVFVANGTESSVYNFDDYNDGDVIDFGNYNATVSKNDTTRKLTFTAKKGYAFKSAEFIASDNLSIVGNDDIQKVATLNEYTISLIVDYSNFAQKYFAVKNVDMIEEYSLLTLKDEENGSNADQNYYYFYGYADNVSSERNPAPFGFVNFGRVDQVKMFSKKGYDFAGFSMTVSENTYDVVNKDGKFVGNSSMFNVVSNNIVNYTLNVKYTPKHYKITYKSGGTILTEQKDVVFDQKIGELLDATTITPDGYTFAGWYYADSLVDENFVYTIDANITLLAKYDAIKYQLRLHTNTDQYQNVLVGGFNYNINKLILSADFNGKLIGDDVFGQTLTKTITYNETYGDLPKLDAKETKDGKEQSYIFVGWFDSSTFTVEDGEFNFGTKYTSQTKIQNNPPVLDLYAHYQRKIYRVDLSETGENVVKDNIGNVVKHIEKIRYSGADKLGEKKNFSSISETDTSLWTKTNNVYNMYALEAESISFEAFVNTGYYISKITITIFDGSNKQTFVFNGVVDKNHPNSYSLTGESDKVVISNTNTNVTILFNDLYTSKVENGQNVYASVDIQTSARTFDNIFNVSQDGLTIKNNETVIDDIDSDIVYNVDKLYELTLPYVQDKNGNNIQNLYIKSLEINGQSILFGFEYKEVEGIYHNALTYSISAESFVVDGDTIIYKFYVNNALVIVLHNVKTGDLSYTISINSSSNNTLNIVLNSFNSSVLLNLQNISTSENKKDGTSIILDSFIDGNSSSSQVESGYKFETLKSADSLNFRITLKDGFVLRESNGFTISYNGNTYNIMDFVNVYNKTNITQKYSITASAEVFEISDSTVKMKGTGIEIKYNADSKMFEVNVSKISGDLEINLSYMRYSIISVHSLFDSYDILANGGEYDGESVISYVNSTDVLKRIDNDIISYIIFKNESNIENLTLKTKSDQTKTFIITYSYSETNSGLAIDSKTSLVEIDLSKTYGSRFSIDILERNVEVVSKLGRGEGIYDQDPISSEFGLLSKITYNYYDKSANLISKSFTSSNEFVKFYGSSISFKIYNITGYVFENAVLKLNDGSEIKPSTNSYLFLDSDPTGMFRLYEYSLDELSGNEFTFEVVQRAVKYKIRYNTNSDDVIDDQECFYNVWFNISNKTLTKTGYNFVGYSLDNKTGEDLTQSDAQYLPGQNITSNLAYSDGTVVNLYAIYTAKSFEINYNLNDSESGNGSSPAIIVEVEKHYVRFDHLFPTLKTVERLGYTFVGWFTSPEQDAIKVSAGNKFTLDVYNVLSTKSENSITLYAKYEAVSYKVTINLNDNTKSNGSSPASVKNGSLDISLKFDENFNLPTLARVGYEFKGYKPVQLSSDQEKISNLYYIGIGQGNKIYKTLNYSYLTSSEGRLLEIDHNAQTINIYAVYTAEIFKGYINLNNITLSGYGQNDFIGKIVLENGMTYQSKTAFTEFCLEYEFDKQFSSLPEITLPGYTSIGMYSSKNFDVNVPTSENRIVSSTVFDYELYKKLLFSTSDNETYTLEYEYSQGLKIFSIYSHYIYNDLKISVKTDNVIHAETDLTEFEDYDYSTVSSGSQNNSTRYVHYNKDIVFDIWTEAGQYVRLITISYVDGSATKTINYIFSWDGDSFMLSRESAKSGDETFTKMSNAQNYLFNGTYIKIFKYNQTRDDTCRVLFVIENVKKDISISLNSNKQEFNFTYYTYAIGSDGLDSVVKKVEGASKNYGDILKEEDLKYAYLPGYKFVGYKYAKYNSDKSSIIIDGGENVNVGDRIVESKVVAAIYQVSKLQKINFYVYDVGLGKYVKHIADQDYCLYYYDETIGIWQFGAKANETFNTKSTENDKIVLKGGTVLSLPSTDSAIWPKNTTVVGYVISNNSPADGKYYSFVIDSSDNPNVIDASSLEKFDFGNTKIEEEINVYAVYNPQKFELSAEIISNKISVSANYKLYQEYNGTFVELTYKDIFVVALNASQFETYQSQRDQNDSKEVSLRTVLGNSYNLKQNPLDSNNKYYFDKPGEKTYYFAYSVYVDENGIEYIYQVSDKCIVYETSGKILTRQI